MKRGLIAGGSRDWAWALGVVDRGKRKLPLREQNWLLDQIAIAQDAEIAARAAAIERLRRPKP